MSTVVMRRVGLGAYESAGIEPSAAEVSTRQRVAIGSLVGGATLFVLGVSAAKAAKFAGLAGVAYGIWLQMNLNTTLVLPWEKSR